ncbi:unnamed protein product, partial [Closterium sp. NIES-53]
STTTSSRPLAHPKTHPKLAPLLVPSFSDTFLVFSLLTHSLLTHSLLTHCLQPLLPAITPRLLSSFSQAATTHPDAFPPLASPPSNATAASLPASTLSSAAGKSSMDEEERERLVAAFASAIADLGLAVSSILSMWEGGGRLGAGAGLVGWFVASAGVGTLRSHV